jgi:hypothetical protein
MGRLLLFSVFVPGMLWGQFNTTLSPKTTAAFDQYQKTAEGRLSWKPRYSQIRPGEVKIDPADGDGSKGVTDGLLHDWVAATLVRGASVSGALAVLQDYAAYKNIYAPEILDSRSISRNGGQWRVGLKIQKTKVITVVLNGEFDVEYRELAPGRWSMTSRSTRLVEVDDSRELKPGTGHGFLWRLNAYWLIEQRPEGVYLECRTLSLSRDVPFLLGPVVRPFVTDIPRESLQKTMDATIRALRERPSVAE